MPTTYTAAIGITPDVVEGDNCDVLVAENVIHLYTEDENGNEVPHYSIGDTIAMEPIDIGIPTDSDDLTPAIASAAAILATHGWTVTGPWESSDNALYAPAQRTAGHCETATCTGCRHTYEPVELTPGPSGDPHCTDCLTTYHDNHAYTDNR